MVKSWNHQEVSLTAGFLSVVLMFSVAEFMTESVSIIKWEQEGCYNDPMKTILLVLTSTILLSTTIVISVIKSFQVKGHIFCYYFTRIALFFCPVAFLFIFTSSTYMMVFILGFAYPLYVLGLVALHIAIIFTFTIVFGVLVAQILADYEHKKIAVIINRKISST